MEHVFMAKYLEEWRRELAWANLDITVNQADESCVDCASHKSELLRVLSSSDLAVVCSGTALLDACSVGIPVVCIYKTDMLTAFIAKRRARVSFASIPNLIWNRRVIPELLFEQCTAPALSQELLLLFSSANHRLRQIRKSRAALRWLRREHRRSYLNVSPSKLAAHRIFSVVDLFKSS